MSGAKTIGQLISLMQDRQERLDAESDGRRHWHGVYRRGTIVWRTCEHRARCS